jgi:MerR family mercuric resistance operon transcriptional regulator
VRFIKRAQELGFTLGEVADLLALREGVVTACKRVELRAGAALQRIDERIRDLEHMRGALAEYAVACRSSRPVDECPLLSALDRQSENGTREREKTLG